MGFFQDLKEDLSMAVNELIPEADEELAVSEENGEKEEKETDGETTQEAAVVVNEDVFRAAVERLDENADVFADSSMQEPEEESAVPAEEEIEKQIEEQTVQQQDEQPEEPVDEPAADEPIIAEPEMPNEDISDSLVKEVCAEVEHADEETELEKEVGKVMTQQSETVLKGEAADETAIITNGMKVTGDISSQGSLDVLGAVKGNIEILGKLNISGEVEGNSIAAEVFADSANITGEIHASGSVKVGQSSVIIGNIFANSAVIAGAVKGDIDVQGPVVLDTSAIVMGNIKSKSVQINNGAVIEGMCSQCYADVNPASFFQDLNK